MPKQHQGSAEFLLVRAFELSASTLGDRLPPDANASSTLAALLGFASAQEARAAHDGRHDISLPTCLLSVPDARERLARFSRILVGLGLPPELASGCDPFTEGIRIPPTDDPIYSGATWRKFGLPPIKADGRPLGGLKTILRRAAAKVRVTRFWAQKNCWVLRQDADPQTIALIEAMRRDPAHPYWLVATLLTSLRTRAHFRRPPDISSEIARAYERDGLAGASLAAMYMSAELLDNFANLLTDMGGALVAEELAGIVLPKVDHGVDEMNLDVTFCPFSPAKPLTEVPPLAEPEWEELDPIDLIQSIFFHPNDDLKYYFRSVRAADDPELAVCIAPRYAHAGMDAAVAALNRPASPMMRSEVILFGVSREGGHGGTRRDRGSALIKAVAAVVLTRSCDLANGAVSVVIHHFRPNLRHRWIGEFVVASLACLDLPLAHSLTDDKPPGTQIEFTLAFDKDACTPSFARTLYADIGDTGDEHEPGLLAHRYIGVRLT